MAILQKRSARMLFFFFANRADTPIHTRIYSQIRGC